MAMLPAETGSGGGNSGEAGGGSGGDGRKPRQHLVPKSYEDILRFAIENTTEEEQIHEPMSEERKKWLQQALSGMFTDEIKIMKKKLEELESIIGSESDEDQEKKEILLEHITDLCDTIDNARDFLKIGGLKVLLHCIGNPSSEIRWRALELAATILQNNPYVQDKFLEEKLMKIFIKIAEEDESNQVRVKAIYALSCHVREHDASSAEFAASDGFSCLMKAMQSGHEKLQIKAAFLLKALLVSQPRLKDAAQQVGTVSQLVGLLNTEHTSAHEHLVGALLCLVTDHPPSIDDCRQPELKLQEFLQTRMAVIKDKEEFLEEHQYCEELLSTVFGSSNQNQAPVDR